MDAEPGDFLMFSADEFEVTCKVLHGLRKRLGAELELYDPQEMNFSWIVEFPMFARDDETGGWTAMHHPFTAPRPQRPRAADDRPLGLSCPGIRPGDQRLRGGAGGTVRIHDSEVQSQVFSMLGIDEETAQERFGFLLEALQFWRPATRRHRPGHRPRGDAIRRPGQHPRLHRLPQNATSHRPNDRSPRPGRPQPTPRSEDQDREVSERAGLMH